MPEKTKKKLTVKIPLDEEVYRALRLALRTIRENDPEEVMAWGDELTIMYTESKRNGADEVCIMGVPIQIFKSVALGFQILSILATDSNLAKHIQVERDAEDPRRN